MPVNDGILIHVPHLILSTSSDRATRCTTRGTTWWTSTGNWCLSQKSRCHFHWYIDCYQRIDVTWRSSGMNVSQEDTNLLTEEVNKWVGVTYGNENTRRRSSWCCVYFRRINFRKKYIYYLPIQKIYSWKYIILISNILKRISQFCSEPGGMICHPASANND